MTGVLTICIYCFSQFTEIAFMKNLVTFCSVSEAALRLSGSVGHRNPLLVAASLTWVSLAAPMASSHQW